MIRCRLVGSLLALAFAVALTACGGDDPVATGDSVEPVSAIADDDVDAAASGGAEASGGTSPTIAGKWILEGLTVDGAAVSLPPAGELGMEIELGRIRGSGGCNTFDGSIDRTDGGSLVIEDLSMTEMGCDLLDFEQVYVGALAGANTWEAGPDGIVFRGDNSELRYGPGAPPVHLALVGTEWVLDTLYAGEGVGRTASTPDMSQPEVVLTITGEIATLRSEGCADYSLALRYEDGRDGPMLAPETETLREPECSGPSDNMFAALDGLVGASGFMVDENRLTLIGFAGELVGFRG